MKIASSLNVTLAFLFVSTLCFGQQANVNLDYNPQEDTEGLIPFSAPINSPHPNATKLALNWFLSKDGQTANNELANNRKL